MAESEFLDCIAERPAHLESMIGQRSCPGLIVLTADLQCAYINPQATKYCRAVDSDNPGDNKSADIPEAILELGNDIRTILQLRRQEEDWKQSQLSRLIDYNGRAILLRAFGLHINGKQGCHQIIIIMEHAGRRQELALEDTKTRFNLTNREESVVQHLAGGLTNRQIANALSISEQTVKQHIKHIMHKTQTSTRTGILMTVLSTQFSR